MSGFARKPTQLTAMHATAPPFAFAHRASSSGGAGSRIKAGDAEGTTKRNAGQQPVLPPSMPLPVPAPSQPQSHHSMPRVYKIGSGASAVGARAHWLALPHIGGEAGVDLCSRAKSQTGAPPTPRPSICFLMPAITHSPRAPHTSTPFCPAPTPSSNFYPQLNDWFINYRKRNWDDDRRLLAGGTTHVKSIGYDERDRRCTPAVAEAAQQQSMFLSGMSSAIAQMVRSTGMADGSIFKPLPNLACGGVFPNTLTTLLPPMMQPGVGHGMPTTVMQQMLQPGCHGVLPAAQPVMPAAICHAILPAGGHGVLHTGGHGVLPGYDQLVLPTQAVVPTTRWAFPS